MKIIYIANSGKIQGAGKALLNIIDGVLSQNIEPIVILPETGPIKEELDKKHVRYHIFYYRNSVNPPLRNILDYLLWLPRLLYTLLVNAVAKFKFTEIVKIEHPDIIHSNSGVIRFGSFVAQKYQIPHVWHIREYQTLDFGWNPIGGLRHQKRLYSETNNRCIAITNDVYAYFNLSDNKDAVIYDGVFSESCGLPVTEIGNYVLFVGCLIKNKGVLDAVDAFCSIQDRIPKDTELWLVGKDEVNIIDCISSKKCKNKIKYLGFRDDIYKLMAGAKALIVPSYFEGFGFITAEAMLNKCIVIGRNTGGTKEQFDNAYNITNMEIGQRFENQQELEFRLQDVINNPSQYERQRHLGQKVVLSLYTSELHAKQILNLYKSIN